MKTYSFTDQEASELALFYKHKLEEVKQRLENIEGILTKLDIDPDSVIEDQEGAEVDSEVEEVEAQAQEAVEASAETEEQTAETEEIDIEISKFNWSDFILQSLTRNDSVFTMAELVDMGIKCYNLNKDERGKISKKVTPFFTQLLKNEDIKKFNIEGQTGYFYGLSDWFLKNGRVKKPYLARFTDDKKRVKKDERFHDNELQNFVASCLFEERRLLTLSELVDRAANEFGYPDSDKAIFIHNLKDEMGRMIENKDLVEFEVPAAAEKHFALPSWFKTNNEIRKPFITW